VFGDPLRAVAAGAIGGTVVVLSVATVFPATIFDFNGVLVDDELVHRDAFRDVLGPLGVAFSDEAYVERYLGFDDIGAIRSMLHDAGKPATPAEVQALAGAKRPFYMRRAEAGLVVFDGAADVVRRRATKGPVAIVSGALREEIAFALRRMGISDLVSVVISADDTPRCKPDPMGYELCIGALAERLGGTERARRALVIEDSLAGIESAKGAGLVCIAVAHSYPAARLREAGADAVVARITDISDALVDDLYREHSGSHG
jgi:HAD superfamily hydrolase (TIGR01509 family)